MFVGLEFCSDSILMTSSNAGEIIEVEIMNGIYDDLFGSVNPDIKQSDESKDWNFDTRFYAKFQNNLIAGNIDYTASTVSSVRIKRRKKDEHTWLTLYEIPINENEDFNFELIDRYVQGNQSYYYALVPMIENVEGNFNKNIVTSEFSNFFILDRDIEYPIIFDTKLNMQINNPIGVINTIGRTYPFVISNGMNQYKTGSFTFSLIPFENCDVNFDSAFNYREQFEKWIMDGNPKILKDWTGQIYMFNITDSIPIDYSYYNLPSYEIQFTEIGDPLDMDDLYYNNFIDVNYSVVQS